MKQVFLFFLGALLITGAKAQNAEQYIQQAQGVVEAIAFKQTTHDFGKIPQGKPVFYEFEFTNKTSAPLKLDNVQASCGCTTPEWHKEPVAPGATDKIKVGYNAAAEGPFEKFITITYNGNASKQIIIKGTVWKAPAEPAPANASVQFLKQQIQ